MASTSDFKNGLCIEFNNDLYSIVSFQHVKPGKGGAFVRTKLKNIRSGRVVEHTFNAGVKVTTARVERRAHQFLYNDGQQYHFMDNETFVQMPLEKHLINAPQFLADGQHVEVVIHAENNEVLGCELPPFVELEVTYTEPGFKGDTATRTFKPATLSTGANIQVPLFIDNGDWLKIDTRTGAYTERIKK